MVDRDLRRVRRPVGPRAAARPGRRARARTTSGARARGSRRSSSRPACAATSSSTTRARHDVDPGDDRAPLRAAPAEPARRRGQRPVERVQGAAAAPSPPLGPIATRGAGSGVKLPSCPRSPLSAGPDYPPGGRSDLLRAVAAGTATVTGEAFYRSLTRHLAEAFGAEVAFVAGDAGRPTRARAGAGGQPQRRRPARGLRVPPSRARRAR